MAAQVPRVSAEDEFEAAPQTTRRLTDNLSVEELNLPKSMVTRIAKGVLPNTTQVQKEALLAISKSATVFVNYLASHASDRATLNNKKTIHPDDVFQALKDLEFDGFVQRCQEEEKRYAAMLNDKRNNYRHRLKEQQNQKTQADAAGNDSGPSATQSNGDPVVIVDERRPDEPPSSKKPRLSSGAQFVQSNPNAIDLTNEDGGDTVDEYSDHDEDQEEEEEDDANGNDIVEEDEDMGYLDNSSGGESLIYTEDYVHDEIGTARYNKYY